MTVILENSWQKSCKMTVIEGKLSADLVTLGLYLLDDVGLVAAPLHGTGLHHGAPVEAEQMHVVEARHASAHLAHQDVHVFHTVLHATHLTTKHVPDQHTHRGGDQSQRFIMHKFIKVKTFHANFTNLTTRSELFIEIGYKVQLYIIEKEIMLLLR